MGRLYILKDRYHCLHNLLHLCVLLIHHGLIEIGCQLVQLAHDVVDVVCYIFILRFHGLKTMGPDEPDPNVTQTRYEQCKYNVFIK